MRELFLAGVGSFLLGRDGTGIWTIQFRVMFLWDV